MTYCAALVRDNK